MAHCDSVADAGGHRPHPAERRPGISNLKTICRCLPLVSKTCIDESLIVDVMENNTGTSIMDLRVDLDGYIAEIVREGERFAAVADAGTLDAPIAACPGWDVRELVTHVGMVHLWAATNVNSTGSGNCMSCHFYGEFPLDRGKADLAAMAPNMDVMRKRLRPEWVKNWLLMPGLSDCILN